jgi:hypothetical protein
MIITRGAAPELVGVDGRFAVVGGCEDMAVERLAASRR